MSLVGDNELDGALSLGNTNLQLMEEIPYIQWSARYIAELCSMLAQIADSLKDEAEAAGKSKGIRKYRSLAEQLPQTADWYNVCFMFYVLFFLEQQATSNF